MTVARRGSSARTTRSPVKIGGDKLVQLEEDMRSAMDEYTEDEAEEVYRNT